MINHYKINYRKRLTNFINTSMKKVFSLIATAILAVGFTACSQSDVLEDNGFSSSATSNDNAVQFGTYMGKTGVTRAGTAGTIAGTTSADFKSAEYVLDEKGGFGVSAYYTQGTDYAVGSTATPNFMYNQKVEKNASDGDGSSAGAKYTVTTWKYDPIKYWPNEFAAGDVDTQDPDAQGASSNGKVTFFAYAPYVATPGTDTDAALTGKNNNSSATIAAGSAVKNGDASGILAMTKNNFGGHPYLQYKLASLVDMASNVDLLWGTAGTNGVNAATAGTQAGSTLYDLDGEGYKVNTDLVKMQTGDANRVAFNFKHALALVGGYDATGGGLTIQLDADEAIATKTIGGETKPVTKVMVESITITNDLDKDGSVDTEEQISQGGVFNLATGEWNLDAATDPALFTQTIDVTGTTDAKLNADIAWSNPTMSSLGNVQTYFKSTTETGVVEATKKNVFDANDYKTALVYLPGTTPKLNFTIVYRVLTYDESLATWCSNVQQTISRVVTFPDPVKLNKRYNVNIILGLTSVKFTATVEDWDRDIDNDSNVDDDDDTEIYLPANVAP